MEATLMYLTGNDSRLADDLICALSALFVSFFASEKETRVSKVVSSMSSKEG